MKKALIFLFAFIFALGFVNAQDVTVDGDSSTTVTVGDVETPVYEVIVSWYGMVYDWGYISNTGEYGWKTRYECTDWYIEDEANYLEQVNDGKKFYSDDKCEYLADPEEYNPNATYYYSYEIEPMIVLEDMSTGGKVLPSVAYTPNTKYNFTTMSFDYRKNDQTTAHLSGTTLPDEARLCMKGDGNGPICEPDEYNVYNILPIIGIDTTKTVTTPTSGETIGTITVTFAAN